MYFPNIERYSVREQHAASAPTPFAPHCCLTTATVLLCCLPYHALITASSKQPTYAAGKWVLRALTSPAISPPKRASTYCSRQQGALEFCALLHVRLLSNSTLNTLSAGMKMHEPATAFKAVLVQHGLKRGLLYSLQPQDYAERSRLLELQNGRPGVPLRRLSNGPEERGKQCCSAGCC
jgi:hypothetical protein